MITLNRYFRNIHYIAARYLYDDISAKLQNNDEDLSSLWAFYDLYPAYIYIVENCIGSINFTLENNADTVEKDLREIVQILKKYMRFPDLNSYGEGLRGNKTYLIIKYRQYKIGELEFETYRDLLSYFLIGLYENENKSQVTK